MRYKFKVKDKVYKWFVNKNKYETQHDKTLDPKVYTVSVANKDSVMLYNVPYIVFDYDGNIISTDYRKVINVRVNNRLTGANSLSTWMDAVIVPASVYNQETYNLWDEDESPDYMTKYENKVYNF